jgi:hypothetical protein
MLQGDHGFEETVCQLRHELGNYFIAVDKGIAVAMDMPKIKLELETQQFEDTKAKAEDHGYRGATSSAGRHANPFAANFSSMRILKVELFEKGEDGTQDSLTPRLHDELAMCCLGQVSWMYKKMLYVVCKSWGCISTE